MQKIMIWAKWKKKNNTWLDIPYMCTELKSTLKHFPRKPNHKNKTGFTFPRNSITSVTQTHDTRPKKWYVPTHIWKAASHIHQERLQLLSILNKWQLKSGIKFDSIVGECYSLTWLSKKNCSSLISIVGKTCFPELICMLLPIDVRRR